MSELERQRRRIADAVKGLRAHDLQAWAGPNGQPYVTLTLDSAEAIVKFIDAVHREASAR